VTSILLHSVLVLVIVLSTPLTRGQESPSFPAPSEQIQLDDSVEASNGAFRDLPVPAWHAMITHIPATWYGTYQRVFQPVKISSLVGMGVLTTALVATDEETWRLTRNFYEASAFNRSFADACVYIGDGLPLLGSAGAFALFGFTTGDRRALRTASQIVEAIVGTALVVHTMKRITGRQRPSRATRPGGVWDVFPNQMDYNRSVPKFDAFPSGHLATTVATLTVIMENYPEVTWLKPVSYTVMGLVAFGLVNRGMHWYSDFPMAIALGHLIGTVAAHPDGHYPEEAQNGTKFNLTPMIVGNQAGLTVEVDF
jgi:membrane-associated phospholipid phosphatase